VLVLTVDAFSLTLTSWLLSLPLLTENNSSLVYYGRILLIMVNSIQWPIPCIPKLVVVERFEIITERRGVLPRGIFHPKAPFLGNAINSAVTL